MVENDGHILFRPRLADGVVAVPEYFQQFRVRYAVGVIIYFQSFRMISKVVVGGVFCCAAGVAHAGSHYAIQLPELGIRAPESAQGKGGCFNIHWNLLIYRGDCGF